jgi:hypothetical protein
MIESLGLALSKVTGQAVAYFPSQMGQRFLLEIADNINLRKSSVKSNPAAVVVSSSSGESDLTPVIMEKDLVRYRTTGSGSRVAITSEFLTYESNIGVFKPVVLAGFPSFEDAQITLTTLARDFGDTLATKLDVESSVKEEIESAVAYSMHSTASIFKSQSALLATPWNSAWYDFTATAFGKILKEMLGSDLQASDIRNLVTCAFGLPALSEDGKYRTNPETSPGTFMKAVGRWWADAPTIQESSNFLNERRSSGSIVSDISACDLGGMREAVQAADASPLAFLYWLQQCSDSVDGRRYVLTEEDFLNPRFKPRKSPVIGVFHRGESLDIDQESKSQRGPYLVVHSSSAGRDDELEIRIRIAEESTPTNTDLEDVNFNISGTGAEWTSYGIRVEPDYVAFKGAVRLNPDLTTKLSADSMITIKWSYRLLPTQSLLVGKIPDHASVELLLVPEFPSAGVIYFNSYSSSKREYNSASLSDSEQNYEIDTDIKSISVLTFGQNHLINGTKPAQISETGWNKYRVSMPERIDVSGPEGTLSLIKSGGGARHQSPLIAAAFNETLGNEAPSLANGKSARGVFEACLAENIESASFLKANFHFLVGEDVLFDSPSSALQEGFITTNATFQALNSSFELGLSDDFLGSTEVAEFQEALTAMRFGEKLRPDAGQLVDSPSRSSWRVFWEDERDSLNRYLNAFTEMVDCAMRNYGNLEVFWATYPFSFSVWDLKDAKCSSVMLSPLHPIRLSWLASVESTLWHAENSETFLGVVEGWNFPYFGPSPRSDAQMLAIPTDLGDSQLFLGWSMLVSLDSTRPSSPTAPNQIAKLPGLGASLSGFNASTANSALQSFRALNPQLSSVVIDLAAPEITPRLGEVDEAVVEVMRNWTKNPSEYPGGVHALDSVNRVGSAPMFEVQKLTEDRPRSFLSWRRYDSSRGVSKFCNVRMLQDSGVHVLLNPGDSHSGIIDVIPVRRFTAISPPSSKRDQSSAFQPTTPIGMGWEPFNSALRACESSDKFPQITAHINRPILSDMKADWTVTGEGMLSPSTISRMIGKASEGGQMLWEWQPPYFRKKDSSISRRPFITIARVPKTVQSQVTLLLKRIGLDEDESANIAARVLKTLGTKGVGLSSLLSQGGTQTYGALGFYIALELLENIKIDNHEVLFMPIDAAQTFLEGLSGVVWKKTKRADLLAIVISPNSLQLIPIEIKLYGLRSGEQAQKLPDFNSSQLNEAKTQSRQSQQLIEEISRQSEWASKNPDSPSSILWRNSLANLVEVATKLTTEPNSMSAAAAIKGILNCSLRVSTKHPMIAYFQANSKTAHGSKFETNSSFLESLEPNENAILVSDIQTAISSCSEYNSTLSRAWAILFEKNCLSGGSEADLDTPAPAQDQTMRQGRTGEERTAADERDAPSKQTQEAQSREQPIVPEGPTQETHDGILDQGVRFRVGVKNDDRSQEVDFWPANTELTHLNMGILGNLGTGKTQFVKRLVSNIRRTSTATQKKPASFLIFDYKGGYSDRPFLDDVGGIAYEPHKIPLNIFQLQGEYTRVKAYQQGQKFISTIAKLYSGIGPKQKQNLSTCIVDLFEANSGDSPTLNEVFQAYKYRFDKTDSVVAVLDKFLSLEIFDDSPENAVPIRDFLGDRVIVINLHSLGEDLETKNALVTMILDFYFGLMLKSEVPKFHGENPQLRELSSYLLIDEANNIMKHNFPVLEGLLLQGREFGFGVILSSQYLSHFKNKSVDYVETLETWMIHQVPSFSAPNLKQLALGREHNSMIEEIPNFSRHFGMWKSLGYQGVIRGDPFFEIASE